MPDDDRAGRRVVMIDVRNSVNCEARGITMLHRILAAICFSLPASAVALAQPGLTAESPKTAVKPASDGRSVGFHSDHFDRDFGRVGLPDDGVFERYFSAADAADAWYEADAQRLADAAASDPKLTELLAHELVHVAQYARLGGEKEFGRRYWGQIAEQVRAAIIIGKLSPAALLGPVADALIVAYMFFNLHGDLGLEREATRVGNAWGEWWNANHSVQLALENRRANPSWHLAAGGATGPAAAAPVAVAAPLIVGRWTTSGRAAVFNSAGVCTITTATGSSRFQYSYNAATGQLVGTDEQGRQTATQLRWLSANSFEWISPDGRRNYVRSARQEPIINPLTEERP
jgi:hypothetical protein